MAVASLNPLHAQVTAANLPLERLAGSSQVTDQEKIAEVSRQFEAVLLRQILAQAQKPLYPNALTGGGGSTNAIYQDMITQQLADRISQGGTFGFGKVLEKELSARYVKKAPVEAKPLKLASTAPAGFSARTEAAHAAPANPADHAKPAEKKYISVRIQPGKRI